MVLEGITGVYEHICLVWTPNELERSEILGVWNRDRIWRNGRNNQTKSTSQAISHGNLLKKYQTDDSEN